ncbi:MAG: small basic protein [Thermoguttaceae bacterium]|nr:small basic protein [Thermoguttaceae bacterium]
MTMDKSLKVRKGMSGQRSVLTRGERIEHLKKADRWDEETTSPYGLVKVRVYKIQMKKKKKKEAEEAEAAPAKAKK